MAPVVGGLQLGGMGSIGGVGGALAGGRLVHSSAPLLGGLMGSSQLGPNGASNPGAAAVNAAMLNAAAAVNQQQQQHHQHQHQRMAPAAGAASRQRSGPTSKYPGVSKCSRNSTKWQVETRHKGTKHYLGAFDSEEAASSEYTAFKNDPEAYLATMQKKLRDAPTSSFPGVSKCSRNSKKWQVETRLKGTKHYLGTFSGEAAASAAYTEFKVDPELYLANHPKRERAGPTSKFPGVSRCSRNTQKWRVETR
jgi:hypothetical protein